MQACKYDGGYLLKPCVLTPIGYEMATPRWLSVISFLNSTSDLFNGFYLYFRAFPKYHGDSSKLFKIDSFSAPYTMFLVQYILLNHPLYGHT